MSSTDEDRLAGTWPVLRAHPQGRPHPPPPLSVPHGHPPPPVPVEHPKELAPLAFLARLEERPPGWWQGDTDYLDPWTKEFLLVKVGPANHDPEQNRTYSGLAFDLQFPGGQRRRTRGLQDKGPAHWADILCARTCKAWRSELQILTCMGPFWLRGMGNLLSTMVNLCISAATEGLPSITITRRHRQPDYRSGQ